MFVQNQPPLEPQPNNKSNPGAVLLTLASGGAVLDREQPSTFAQGVGTAMAFTDTQRTLGVAFMLAGK